MVPWGLDPLPTAAEGTRGLALSQGCPRLHWCLVLSRSLLDGRLPRVVGRIHIGDLERPGALDLGHGPALGSHIVPVPRRDRRLLPGAHCPQAPLTPLPALA